jgi:hypothetical protein
MPLVQPLKGILRAGITNGRPGCPTDCAFLSPASLDAVCISQEKFRAELGTDLGVPCTLEKLILC